MQAERQLSAAALADPTAYRTRLANQRQITDASVEGLQGLPDSAPADIVAHYRQVTLAEEIRIQDELAGLRQGGRELGDVDDLHRTRHSRVIPSSGRSLIAFVTPSSLIFST
ncbi:nitrate- and nitrite sensing domain-containing protein [Streptomyces sp. NPDC002577]